MRFVSAQPCKAISSAKTKKKPCTIVGTKRRRRKGDEGHAEKGSPDESNPGDFDGRADRQLEQVARDDGVHEQEREEPHDRHEHEFRRAVGAVTQPPQSCDLAVLPATSNR